MMMAETQLKRRPRSTATSFQSIGISPTAARFLWRAPAFRVTRSSRWQHEVNPWKEKDRLPLLEGGILSELIYSGQPRLFDDFAVAARRLQFHLTLPDDASGINRLFLNYQSDPAEHFPTSLGR